MPDVLDRRLGDAANRLATGFDPEPPLISTLVRNRRNRRLGVGALAIVACLGLALIAITSAHPTETVRTTSLPEGVDTWSTQSLSNPTVPQTLPPPAALGVTTTRSVILTVEPAGLVHSWVAGPDGRFRVGTDSRTGIASFGAAGLVVIPHDGGWLAIGSGSTVPTVSGSYYGQDVTVLRSSNGIRWTRVDTTGLGEGGTISGATSVDGTVVVVGTWSHELSATNDTHHAVVWASADGTHWTESRLPASPAWRDHSEANAVRTVDGILVAIGNAANRNLEWISRDHGRTWKQVSDGNIADLPLFDELASDGHRMVATAPAPVAATPARIAGATLYHSIDDGRTWRATTDRRSAGIASPDPQVAGTPGRIVILEHPHGVSTCEPDQASCPGTASHFTISIDGAHWTEVTPGPGPADQFAVAPDGRIVSVHFAEKVQISTWNPSAESPPAPSTSKP